MEPTRIEQEGGTADELALLRAARRDRPPAGAPARALAAISIAAGFTAVGAPAAAAAGTTSAAMGLGKWFATGALLGVVSAGSVHVLSHTEPATRSVVERSAPPLEARAANVAPSLAAHAATPAEAVITVDTAHPSESAAPPTRAPTPAPEPPRGTLAEERALLERARGALRSGASGDAERALARYTERFRAGALADEASVLQIELALTRGNTSFAVTLCDAYLTSRADGPHTARVRAMRQRALTEK